MRGEGYAGENGSDPKRMEQMEGIAEEDDREHRAYIAGYEVLLSAAIQP